MTPSTLASRPSPAATYYDRFWQHGVSFDAFLDTVEQKAELWHSNAKRGSLNEDELDRVFEKFHQSSRSRDIPGGTGLGLAICREIVELHRGRIWAENNADAGSSIHVELPVG